MAEKKTTGQKGTAAGCADRNCPLHGSAKTRGRGFTGMVLSDKMSKTAVVGWSRRFFVKKFERHERRTSRINAHNPACMNARKGDVVRIAETRPLSKTKHFTITEILGKESKKEHLKMEAIEEAEEIENASKKKEEKSEKGGKQ